MVLQSTGKQYNLFYFECPRWADVLAQVWLIFAVALGSLRKHYPKAQVYAMSRYDIALKHLTPYPVALTFARFVIVFLWIDFIYNIASSLIDGGGLCLA